MSGSGFSRQGDNWHTAAFTLVAVASCTVTVRLGAMAAVHASSQLNAVGAGATASIGLSGTGLNPAALPFDQARYDFGSVNVGDQADPTVTLSNIGGVDAVNVQLPLRACAETQTPWRGRPEAAAVGGWFSQAHSGTGISRAGGGCAIAAFPLPAGSSCTVEPRFASGSVGAANGSLSVSADAGLAASAIFTGQGLAVSALAFAPASFDVGDMPMGGSAELTSTLSNIGGSAVPGIELMLRGAGFSRICGSCDAAAFSLAACSSSRVILRFMPAMAGSAMGSPSAIADAGLSAR
ncbi:MAG: choice-of-anchor D domain-containing protein [Aquimonas sp.]|nr:choice-of-anchor D domain-containing protein [Aquimonas sp.]